MKKFKPVLIFLLLLAFICVSGGQSRSMSRFMGQQELDISDDGKAVPKESTEGQDLLEDEEVTRTDETGKKIPVKEEEKLEKKAEEAASDEDEEEGVFMGEKHDTDIEKVEAYQDSPAYLATKRKIFIEPSARLGARPLKLTLEDCIRIALVNNNKVQATQYGIDAANAQYDLARARFWPVFEYEWLSAPIPQNVNHAVGNFFRGNLAWWNKFKVGMGIPLYAFGKLTIAQDLARGGIAAEREKRNNERISTVTQVRKLYYGVLLAEELGRLLVKAHNKLSSAVAKKEDEDGRSPIDKIKANVFLVDLEKRLAEVRDKETLALEGLRVQLGLNPDVAVMVYSTNLRPITTKIMSFEHYKEIALDTRPDVKLVEIGLETRRKQYDLEKRNFLPDIGFGAYLDVARADRTIYGLTTTDNFSNPFNYTRAGIGMQVKGKFDVHGQYAKVKKAKSEYYKASLDHYMAKDGITLELKKAYLDTERAQDDVRRSEKAEKLARQMMFLSQSNFELGVGEEEDYIDSLELVLLTRGRYFEAVFNYNVALAVLDEKAGIIPLVKNDAINEEVR